MNIVENTPPKFRRFGVKEPRYSEKDDQKSAKDPYLSPEN